MCRPPISMTLISLLSGSFTLDGFGSLTPAPSLMSVPRPAMFVAIVIAPGCPAPATISASRWWYFALRTLCWRPRATEHLRQRLRRFDARRTDQHREPEVVQAPRLLDDRVVLLAARLVHEIVAIFADHRLVRRNDRDLEFIDLEKLRLFRFGRAGHTGQLVVHAEVVLDRDRGHASASRL